MNENQFRNYTGLTAISKYVKQGIIKPYGKAITNFGLSNFYRPKQKNELYKAIGITLSPLETKSLLNEKEIYRKFKINITKVRNLTVIKPYGHGMSNAGVSPYYHPKQIKELKKRLMAMKDKK